MEVVKWVSVMPESISRSATPTPHGLVEIIEHRHPFNVREQLRAFAKCCENVFLHREWLKSRKPRKGREIPWSEKSYEFFLRVFLLGEARFFSEEFCELPNVYDDGSPNSSFNACIRNWLLGYLVKDTPFFNSEILDAFASAGIPQQEIQFALDTFIKYRIIYPLREGSTSVLSIWGEYFRKYIAYDLPYISTMWWTTHVFEPYSLGDARELYASELRGFSGTFLRWLRCEESLARSRLKDNNLALVDIFKEASYQISYSLRKIESVI